jgi:hypothetical protein
VTRRVLLDVQPPDLATITIQKNAALVLDNMDMLLNVSYIAVFGELHIGSQSCSFRKSLTINLFGEPCANGPSDETINRGPVCARIQNIKHAL